MSPETTDLQKAHRFFSVECFNQCWALIDKPERAPEEMEDMLLLAATSMLHWKQRDDCQPFNLSIGYWQLARVCALVGQHDLARWFGEKCLAVSTEEELPAFYIGYAYESLVRAEIGLNEIDSARLQFGKAQAEFRKL